MERSGKYKVAATMGVVLVAALLVAYLTGSFVSLSWADILADGVIFAISMVILGFFTHKMNVYGMPAYVQVLIFCSGIIGLPVLAMYFYLDLRAFNLYTTTLPLRALISLLLFIIFKLWIKAGNGPGMQDQQEKQETPPLRPGTTDIPGNDYPDKILVRSGNGIKVIPINELLFIQADGDYVWLVTMEGKWLKEETMKHLQEILAPSQFVRIHRSFIVNVSKISRIERFGEQQLIVLINGESVRISASGYRTLRDALGF
ncbi:MAG: LytTR family DNA-binding domain-containing protein [Bacteroidales bacterium]|nr:LytTR family DNA-binding domain-containing protein [Bacteroidales bacterium]